MECEEGDGVSERNDSAGDQTGKALPAPLIHSIHPSPQEHRPADALLGRLACPGAGEPSLAWMSSHMPCKGTKVALSWGQVMPSMQIPQPYLYLNSDHLRACFPSHSPLAEFALTF